MNTENVLPVTEQPQMTPAPLPGRRRPFPWGKVVGVILSLAALPFLLSNALGLRALMAASFAGILFFLVKRSPGVGLAGTVAFLAVLGGLRRWLIPAFGWTGTDPLLLTAPLTVVLFLVVTRRTPGTTRLARLLVLLIALMALEIVNPFQGGLAVGLAGTLFYIVPLLWYFVARQIGTSAIIVKLFQGVVLIALLGALYGLYQTWFGFNAGEKQWIELTKTVYQALSVSDTITRAFSFFTSASEYSVFLALGIVALWVWFLRGSQAALLPIPLLAWALFLESSRTPIFGVLTTCAVLWAVQGRTRQQWIPRGLVALAIGGGGLFFTLGHLQNAQFGDQTQALVSHQVGGLLNPLDTNKSTATVHGNMVLGGVIQGFHNPIGQGLGATTIAEQKFGGVSESSEVDVSNLFISLGFIGGLLYVVVVALVLVSAFRYWQATRSTAALLILGALLATLGGWLSGGHYSVSTLAWICIGTLDRLAAAPGKPQARR